MKVLVINVCLRPYLPHLVPPVGLGYVLTAIDRAGFDYEFLDLDVCRYSSEKAEEIIRNKKFDVAVFGCLVTGYKIVKWLAQVVKDKDPRIPVVVGNSVVTSIPELLLSKTKVDIGVIGEGDITIVELLKALIDGSPLDGVQGICFKRDGRVVMTPKREVVSDINQIPNINWDLFDIQVYLEKSKLMVPEPYMRDYDSLRAMPVNSARGCIYACDFCYHVFRGVKYRPRTSQMICKEIKDLRDKYDVNFIHFYDELTLYSKKQAHELCDTIIAEGLDDMVYSVCARADLLGEDDLDLAEKLKKAGILHVGYSLESADADILKTMNKRLSVKQFKTQSKLLQKVGICTGTSLVIGYPQETPETLQKTFDACLDAHIYPSTGYLVPQPGTPIYEYAKKMGKITDEEEYLINVIGDRQDFRINLTQMSQVEMENLVKQNLAKISAHLNLNLADSKLLKTGNYKTVGEKASS